MIKGCQKRIIMVKDTGSKYFEGAYFVLRSELPQAVRESEMLTEAKHMVDSYNGTALPADHRAKSTVRTCIAIIAVLSAALLAALAALLII